MRYYGIFDPEWGYAASAPSVMRSARSIVVAAILGAIASASTVFSLLDHPVAEQSVAARTLVAPDPGRPLTASASVAVQQPIEPRQIKSPAQAVNSAEQKAPPASTVGRGARPRTSELPATSTPRPPTSAAQLAEAPAEKETFAAQTFNDPVAVAADTAPAPKAQTKKPRMTSRAAPRADGSRYDALRYDRYLDGPRYGYGTRYGYEPRYGSRGAWAPYY